MTNQRQKPNLLVQAQFYEALSGEFETIQNPLVKYSLGELATTIYLDGQRSYEIGIGLGTGGIQFHHQLPWMSEVDSYIFCREIGITPQLSGITLRNNNDGRAISFSEQFYDRQSPQSSRNFNLTPSELNISIPNGPLFNKFILDEQLQEAKAEVTRQVTDFFADAILLK